MALIDWIKDHQVLVGTFIICILLVIGSVITFLVIRSIKKKLEIDKGLDVPPEKPGINIFMSISQKIKEAKMRAKKVKPIQQKVEQPAAPDVGATRNPLPIVDVNSLSVEQLEQLLAEKKRMAVVQTKQITLMAMSKEELAQIIIDNQIEI